MTLQNSILCSRSVIGSKNEIQNSIICANQQIESNRLLFSDFLSLIIQFFFRLGKLNGETISSLSNESTTYMSYDDDDEQ